MPEEGSLRQPGPVAGTGLLCGLLLAALVVVLSGCAMSPTVTHAYKLYPGPERPPAEIAIVRMGDAMAARFDGRPVSRADWREVQLLPGPHDIEWYTEFVASVMVAPAGFIPGSAAERLTLEPGHTYVLRAGRTHGWSIERYFWIVDDTTRQVVAGTPVP